MLIWPRELICNLSPCAVYNCSAAVHSAAMGTRHANNDAYRPLTGSKRRR